MSITEATKILRIQDRILRKFPEVESVFGKAGEADTATDPSLLSMFETVLQLKPPEKWPPGMTWEKLTAQMNEVSKTPGGNCSWKGYCGVTFADFISRIFRPKRVFMK
jgi:copper/silver efflux system protein